MIITFINKRYYPEGEAGPAFSVQALAECLVQVGHQVHVICRGVERDSPCNEHNGIFIHRIPPETASQQISAYITQTLAEHKPDVVHTNWLDGFPLSELGPIINQSGARLVHTLREYNFLCAYGTLFKPGFGPCRQLCSDCGTRRPASAQFSRCVDAVVGVSRFCLGVHVSAGLFPCAETKAVVHNAFRGPAQPIPLVTRSQNSALRLGFLGRIDPAKGIFWLLSQLAGSNLADKLTVTIGGRHTQEMEAKLGEQFPNLSLEWLGFSPPRNLMGKIDWLVVPSICYEALSRVVMEAFAFGIPVLGSNLGGIPEMIRHGENGRLFDPRMPGDLLLQLRWIHTNRDQWEGYRRAAWESRTSYLPEKIVARHLPIYSGPANRDRF